MRGQGVGVARRTGGKVPWRGRLGVGDLVRGWVDFGVGVAGLTREELAGFTVMRLA